MLGCLVEVADDPSGIDNTAFGEASSISVFVVVDVTMVLAFSYLVGLAPGTVIESGALDSDVASVDSGAYDTMCSVALVIKCLPGVDAPGTVLEEYASGCIPCACTVVDVDALDVAVRSVVANSAEAVEFNCHCAS